mmetsp:Transcript_19859/g.29518  ORF Transcript_19859/g.29518 Transcript_19859/m.29518 type:complete len:247 (-) Transcript_19859:210-950(-)|eukprot:CAMPEP_0116019696 /NCGR_PEP_ID=MMETSP0321-20121206/9383_1 /TAXON_ID=163516 /ORGANISM="Leptocylindrus danicus var. danicus, Strain B650" /LENGTH=246 /DNA_ID=CAMNT_0003490301 /DNA_START=27 /DNA_END=767 /DNA_ORIENTATION=+
MKLPIPVSEFASWPFIQTAMKKPDCPKSVLSFYLGVDFSSESTYVDELKDATRVRDINPLWFVGGSEYDELCMPFTEIIRKAGTHELKDVKEWNTTDGKMAQVILCDQLARNCFRGSGESYAYEDISLTLAKELVNQALSKPGSVPSEGEVFGVYGYVCGLPIMHSERLEDHELALDLNDWGKTVTPALGWDFQKKFEIQHKEVIEKFGRYPHRNGELGRVSTEEEVAYLENKDELPTWAGGKKMA